MCNLLGFLVAAEVGSVGEVLMLIDDEDSIKLFFDDAKYWDDSKRKDTTLELLANKGSFPTKLDRKGAVVAFRGPEMPGTTWAIWLDPVCSERDLR